MPAAEQAPSELHEMETLGSTRTRSRSLGKLVSLGSFTMNRDYAVGIGLLLIVVFLWTSSNFVTQVRSMTLSMKRESSRRCRIYLKGVTRNLFCEFGKIQLWRLLNTSSSGDRVTYLNTSAFTLYLIPTLIRRCFGKSQSRPSGTFKPSIFSFLLSPDVPGV
jgi:solute carrier family 35 protein F5